MQAPSCIDREPYQYLICSGCRSSGSRRIRTCYETVQQRVGDGTYVYTPCQSRASGRGPYTKATDNYGVARHRLLTALGHRCICCRSGITDLCIHHRQGGGERIRRAGYDSPQAMWAAWRGRLHEIHRHLALMCRPCHVMYHQSVGGGGGTG